MKIRTVMSLKANDKGSFQNSTHVCIKAIRTHNIHMCLKAWKDLGVTGNHSRVVELS